MSCVEKVLCEFDPSFVSFLGNFENDVLSFKFWVGRYTATPQSHMVEINNLTLLTDSCACLSKNIWTPTAAFKDEKFKLQSKDLSLERFPAAPGFRSVVTAGWCVTVWTGLQQQNQSRCKLHKSFINSQERNCYKCIH